jgi:hypothetical protein
MSLSRFKVTAAAAVLALTAGCGARPYSVSASPKTFLPQQAAAPQPTGLRTVQPDQAVLATPVGWRSAAQLGGEVTGSIVGKTFAFEAGEALPLASVSGSARGNLPYGTVALCGRPHANAAKTLIAASTLGISSILNKTGFNWQVCLLDTDHDAKVEKAILVGVKSEADAAPVAIVPVPYRLTSNARMPGESEARIIYRGKTGLTGGHVSFDLQVKEEGQALFFDNVRTKVDVDKLPQRVSLMGTEFTVRSYNPADGSAVVEIHRGFVPATYGVHSSYSARTQYIPIYIPRHR